MRILSISSSWAFGFFAIACHLTGLPLLASECRLDRLDRDMLLAAFSSRARELEVRA